MEYYSFSEKEDSIQDKKPNAFPPLDKDSIIQENTKANEITWKVIKNAS